MIPTEEQEQRVVAQWLDLHKICWCHVPNGGKRSRIEAAIMNGLGVKAGVPDILIFSLPPVKPKATGAFIEMKRRKGGKLSDAQKEFGSRLLSLGWEGITAHGADEAISFLESLGYGKRRQ